MGVISAHALAVLVKEHAEGEMVYVRIKDATGHRYGGRVTSMQEVKDAPRSSTVDVEAEDGEMAWKVPVYRIIAVDVRPFQHFTGYGVGQFVSDFGASA